MQSRSIAGSRDSLFLLRDQPARAIAVLRFGVQADRPWLVAIFIFSNVTFARHAWQVFILTARVGKRRPWNPQTVHKAHAGFTHAVTQLVDVWQLRFLLLHLAQQWLVVSHALFWHHCCADSFRLTLDGGKWTGRFVKRAVRWYVIRFFEFKKLSELVSLSDRSMSARFPQKLVFISKFFDSKSSFQMLYECIYLHDIFGQCPYPAFMYDFEFVNIVCHCEVNPCCLRSMKDWEPLRLLSTVTQVSFEFICGIETTTELALETSCSLECALKLF